MRRQLLLMLAAVCALHTATALPVPVQEGEIDTESSGALVPESGEQFNNGDDEELYGNLFEGDIAITKEELEEYYGIPQNEGSDNRTKRAIASNKNILWPGGQVYYSFHSSVGSIVQTRMRLAMDKIEALTCINFSPRTDEPNYINIVANLPGCSSRVGMGGGAQTLRMGGCYQRSTATHELLHALGVWHEQSRPDRDDYVEVLEENIEDQRGHNFNKRNKFGIDSQGVTYDYASIMHYGLKAFLNKTRGNATIKVVNEEEYERQGRPLDRGVYIMSIKDIQQLNRLYNCPGSGVPGDLVIHLGHTENQPTNRDAFVEVTAYDDQGQNKTKRAQLAENETLAFGNRVSWQYIEIKTVDEYGYQLTPTQFFSVNEGLHSFQHCRRWFVCSRYSPVLNFTLSLVDHCNCLSGGSCRSDGTCECAEGFSGPHCEFPRGRLRILAHNATNLRDTDTWYSESNLSDVRLFIAAFDRYGGAMRKSTHTVWNSLNPVWDTELDFGVDDWFYFNVIGLDNSRREVGEYNTFSLRSLISVEAQEIEAYDDGRITFSYFFELEN